jgi:general secretion pathway protein N
MLAEARGSWWQGDAVVVLSGGPGSREAWTLPGRIGWTLGLQGLQPVLTLRQPCCLAGEMALRLEPGIGRVGMALMPSTSGGSPPANAPAAAPITAPVTVPVSPAANRAASPATTGPAQAIGQWPAAWLTALGTPWNTLKPAGLVRLSAQRLRIERAEGRWRLSGSLAADFVAMSSSLSTLPSLGSYRVEVSGDAAGVASLALRTVEGPLLLSGQGQWTGGRLRLRGEARAAAGHEAALNNLLNLIGRRQGERALIAIG